MRRVSSQRTRSASASSRSTRRVTSSRLPIGVAQTASGIRRGPSSSASKATIAAPTIPAEVPSSARTIAHGVAHRLQRLPLRAPRAPERAAAPPPPRTPRRSTTSSGSNMLIRLPRPEPELASDLGEQADRLAARPRSRAGRAGGRRQRARRPRVRPRRQPCPRRTTRGARARRRLHGSAVVDDDDVSDLRARADRAAIRPAAEDQTAADAGAEREHDHVARTARRRRPATRRPRRRCASFSISTGRPSRSRITSRSGRSTSGMLTEPIATPRRWSIRDGTPKQTAPTRVVERAPGRPPPARRAAPPRSRAGSDARGGAATVAVAPDQRRRGSSSRRRRRRSRSQPRAAPTLLRRAVVEARCSNAAAGTAAATMTRRMPSEEKPYRVYRGGRAKGKVPSLAEDRAQGGRTLRRFRLQAEPALAALDPGSDRPLPRARVVWAVASYFQFRDGVSAANKRLDARGAAGARPAARQRHATSSCSAPTTPSSRAASRPTGRDSITLVRVRHRPPPDRLPVDPPRPPSRDPRLRDDEDQRGDAGGRARLGGPDRARPDRAADQPRRRRRLRPVREADRRARRDRHQRARNRSSPSSTARTRPRSAARAGTAGASRRASSTWTATAR